MTVAKFRISSYFYTITDDVILTLPYISFEISSPCTKIRSRTRLYNAAASSPSRPPEGGSLAIRTLVKTEHSETVLL